jgi:hypothetical protein
MSYPLRQDAGMNIKELHCNGPFQSGNLGIFIIERPGISTDPGSGDGTYTPLHEAMERGSVKVHETGQVGQLEAENTAEDFDVLILAGDIVKGGRQDRTFGVDFILPKKSGRIPVPTFCVEAARWGRRSRDEAVAHFSASPHHVSSSKIRAAVRRSKSQGAVWESVAEEQKKMSASLKESVQACASPSSYLLSLEHEKLQAERAKKIDQIKGAVTFGPNAVGIAVAINGQFRSADLFASPAIFERVRERLLEAAVIEAISEMAEGGAASAPAPDLDGLAKWLESSAEGKVFENVDLPPRVRIEGREAGKCTWFSTRDTGRGDLEVHASWIEG